MVQATKGRARRQPAEVRREEIIETALRVFARMPYRSAGTAEIAREAGIAEPTIYRHFDSKRELYLAVLARTSSVICEAWQRIVAEGQDAPSILKAIGEWYYQRVVQDADLLRLRHRAAAEADDEDVRKVLRDGYDAVVEIIAGVIRRGQAEGQFNRAVDPIAAAWLFAGIGQVLDLATLTGRDAEDEGWCNNIGEVFRRTLLP